MPTAPKVELLCSTVTLHSPSWVDQVCRVVMRSFRFLKKKPQHAPLLIRQLLTTPLRRGTAAVTLDHQNSLTAAGTKYLNPSDKGHPGLLSGRRKSFRGLQWSLSVLSLPASPVTAFCGVSR